MQKNIVRKQMNEANVLIPANPDRPFLKLLLKSAVMISQKQDHSFLIYEMELPVLSVPVVLLFHFFLLAALSFALDAKLVFAAVLIIPQPARSAS